MFHISVQNIEQGGSNEYPQSMFWAEIRKIMYTPVNPKFYCTKMGVKGEKLYRCDGKPHQHISGNSRDIKSWILTYMKFDSGLHLPYLILFYLFVFFFFFVFFFCLFFFSIFKLLVVWSSAWLFVFWHYYTCIYYLPTTVQKCKYQQIIYKQFFPIVTQLLHFISREQNVRFTLLFPWFHLSYIVIE